MRKFYLLASAFTMACETPKTNDTGEVSDTGSTIDTQLDPNDYAAGCFVVDGGNGFANLNDALLFVDVGSTITFDNCEATHEEAVVIDRSVTIVGPGTDSFTLIAPTNEHGFTIEAEDVSISGLSIDSTRSGIYLNEANNVTLDDISVMQAGNWGVKSEDTVNLSIDNCVMSENGFGGISLIGGDASISNTLMIGNATTGVKAEGSAVTLNTVQATNSIPANETAPEDGYGIWAIDGATVVSVDGLYDYNFLMGVRAEASDIDLTGGSASYSNVAGVFIDPGLSSLSLSNIVIADNYSYGVVAQNTTESSFSGVSISADPTASSSTTAQDEDENGQPDWRESGLTGTGIFTNSDTVSVSDTDITGYNNCGLYAVTDSSDGAMDIQGLDVENVGRLGILIVGFEGSGDNIKVDGVADLDEIELNAPGTMCTSVGTYSGLMLNSANMDISNFTMKNVQAYGLTVYNSSVDISGMEASSNFCSSVMAFEGSASIDQANFSEPNDVASSLGASVTAYMASLLTVDNSTFNEQTDGFSDFHIYMYDTDIAEISNSTFNGGYYGVYSRKTGATYTNNSFVDQRSSAYSVYLSYGDSIDDSSDLTSVFEGNDFTKSASNGSGIRCIYGGQVELKEDSFTDFNGSYALYMDDCSSELEDVSFTNLGGAVSFAYDGNHEWETVTVDGAGQAGLSSYLAYFYPFSGPMNISIADSTFSNIGTSNYSMSGLYASSYNPSANPINLSVSDSTYTGGSSGLMLNGVTGTISDVEISNVSDDGIHADNSDLSIDSLEISNSEMYGIDCNGSTITLNNSNILNAGINGIDGNTYNGSTNCSLNLSQTLITDSVASGISGNYTDLNADTLTVTNNGEYGISIQNASQQVVITNTGIASNGDNGVNLNATDAVINDSTISLNGGYGMSCTDSVTSSCTNNQLENNVLGEQSGCDASCGSEPVPQQETDCQDGIDNDLDGQFDCDDNDCLSDIACVPLTETDCSDGLDNDSDGLFDCDDSDCMNDTNCLPTEELDCTDGTDNDMDGFFDCDDSDCMSDPACVPTVELTCDDGLDNDMDGMSDCDDSDCLMDPACIVLPEADCEDGIDNDGDGLFDCDDSDCQNDAACSLLSYQSDVAFHFSSCTGCHGSSGGFNLSYANMVSVASVDISTMNLIEPGSPADSYLWHKISGTHLSVGGSGGSMPPGGGSLNQTSIDTIEAWILDGALP